MKTKSIIHCNSPSKCVEHSIYMVDYISKS